MIKVKEACRNWCAFRLYYKLVSDLYNVYMLTQTRMPYSSFHVNTYTLVLFKEWHCLLFYVIMSQQRQIFLNESLICHNAVVVIKQSNTKTIEKQYH